MKFLLRSLLLLLSTLVFTSSYATEDEINSALLEESNFQQLAEQMKDKSLGLVLMLHAEHCPYCKLMEEEILSPMVKSGDYDKKVLIRKLQIDEARDVIDFSGKIVEPSEISNRYNTSLTPTLVFLDYQGKERVKQMVGINTVEMFGAYLDIEIDKLAEVLSKKKTSSATAQVD